MCGLSNRGVASFLRPLLGSRGGSESSVGFGANVEDYSGSAELVAVLDADAARIGEFRDTLLPAGYGPVAEYGADDVGRMLDETRPDVLLVTGPDHTHAGHVLAALERGVDVIAEKPMTSTAHDAARVLAAERASTARVRVTHNLRYTPRHRQIRRLIADGAIGRPTHVTLEYHVDTRHGASYFLRWNRTRAASGGLSIHKSCHHLDLINWLIGDLPASVVAHGAQNYFGPRSPHRPAPGDVDPYAAALSASGALPGADGVRRGLFDLAYREQYPQPMSLYDDEIDVEDTYLALVRYGGGAALAYSIDFSSPWEGYTLGISGTHGRIEATYGRERDGQPREGSDHIVHYPLFGSRSRIDVATGAGGHDGADALMRADLFGTPSAESAELGLAASTQQAAYAVAAGEAMWRSASTGAPVDVAALLEGEA
ncbi:oxidoreductase domain protein [Beutenbergia cavernae DSM 12333]|uniref:Oxidoreductase domain protein n=1 Tax=Beutenbergia cavernae (strain ATCC BAA-8 / DSM 12333 / CCUG 43141 / JCM 11478 / NBRC 16432 / NCIMB 13614 / HKI 0122) TaxID=471853 RepID=C5BXW9_BEUC1|nr:oxidoreductase domain protein [Beutenbergia cavernae DSM 12333]